mgnify:CR=1 FL=1|uniref:Uncharacterized protein n=1 Tax=viral metagenome TaxID=1070528 RepID=A0A6C0AZ05_9ZZZZ|tara:strand:- start:28796 stop:29455 length:660 start_codon:yes stop_codon:yes gene_type:complete
MSSLAICAAPVNYENTNYKEMNDSRGKYKNKTIKNSNNGRNIKIKADMIHNLYDDNNDDDSDSNGLADFNDQPYSLLLQKQQNLENSHDSKNEQIQQETSETLKYGVNNEQNIQSKSSKPSSNLISDSPITQNGFSQLENAYTDDYYKQYIPNQYSNSALSMDSNSELLKKLDNILLLLEEQHEEKTSYITEELILYVFLGIFVIFVLDSFVRVGKYTR